MKESQKKSFISITIAICLLTLLAAFTSSAQVVTNTFSNASLDLLANGVLGSGFDGVDLAFGDVPGGNNAGNGNGVTLEANSAAPFTGFLAVQTIDGDWAGAGDDGFFAYNIVWGDFDVSVDVAAVFDAQNYTFAGLLARAISDGSGAPYNPTGTNATENWVNITRFEEFGIPTQVRYASNGVDNQITVGNLYGSTIDTNADVFLRLTRTGDTFNFYDSTTYGGPWTLEQTLSRPDLHGAAMQVGIEEATFGGNSPIIYFADYGVAGTQTITPPANDPANIVVSAPVNSNTLTISWTPAVNSDGSVVVLRPNKPIIQSPAYGFAYVGNPAYGAVKNMGGGQQAVYAGSGNSVTVSGLGGSNNLYTVAVYSYTTNAGATPVTYDSTPVTGNFRGPGTLASVVFSVSPSSIPVEGYGKAIVTATYTSGDSYDVTAQATVTVTNSTIFALSANGDITGLAVGSEFVTATFAGVTGSQPVSIHNPTFSDNFSTPHNYLTTGVAGTGWESLFQTEKDQPMEDDGGNGPEATVTNDASITANDVLTVAAKDTTWSGTANNGFLLAKYVQGDFQAAVHVHGLQRVTGGGGINYLFAGLMARAFNASGLPGQEGGPSTLNTPAAENWVFYSQFSEFGISTISRFALDGNDTQNGNGDGDQSDNFWLLMIRSQGTNFTFYRKVNATDPWQADPINDIVQPELVDGVPLQVGLAQSMYDANVGWVQFDSFMIDTSGQLDSGGAPPTACSNLVTTVNPDFSISLTWSPGTNTDNSEATSFVIGRANAPLSQQPPYGFLSTADAQLGQGTDLGGGTYVLFRGVGNSVTVTGLVPGNTYYFAAYSYSSGSSTKVFDTETAAYGSVQDGSPTNMVATLPVPSIPSFGVGVLSVNLVFPGNNLGQLNVAQYATLTSSDTNIAVVSGGTITGVAPGTTSVQVIYAIGTNTFTNNVQVTVHAPAFSDNFTTAHDYLNNGVTGTPWNGVYAYPNSKVPSPGYVSDPAAAILGADADITTNGALTVSNLNVGWEYNQDDGFFLFKYAPSDFQMQVHLVNFNAFTNDIVTPNSANYDNPGLMARLYTTDTNGAIGAPFTITTDTTNGIDTYGEDWVSWTRFDQFGIGTYARAEVNNNKVVSSTQTTDVGSGQFWLLLVRQFGTNFYFYQKANQSDPWLPAPNGVTYTSAMYANQPMQVGIIACAFNSGTMQVDQFDHFALDVSGSFGLSAVASGGNIVVTWPDQPGVELQSSPSLTTPNWQPVTSPAPTVTAGVASVTIPIGVQNAFFRLSELTP